MVEVQLSQFFDAIDYRLPLWLIELFEGGDASSDVLQLGRQHGHGRPCDRIVDRRSEPRRISVTLRTVRKESRFVGSPGVSKIGDDHVVEESHRASKLKYVAEHCQQSGDG